MSQVNLASTYQLLLENYESFHLACNKGEYQTFYVQVNVILSVEERDITAYIDIVMQSLVTYELAEQCSLSGRNGKYAIGHTKLVQAVLGE